MTQPVWQATLSFAAKVWWSIIRSRLSPTQGDNVVTWDRAVMLTSLLATLEIYFYQIIIAEIHERAFLKTTTMPFPYLIVCICREATVQVWHCDKLVEVRKTVNVGLVKDDVNPMAPRKGI